MGFFFMSRLKSVILEENSGTVHHVVAGSFRRRYLGVALDLSVVVPWVSFFSPLKSATLSSRHFFVVSEGGSLIFWGQKSRLLCESGPKITIQVEIWSPKISKNPDFTQINKQSDTQFPWGNHGSHTSSKTDTPQPPAQKTAAAVRAPGNDCKTHSHLFSKILGLLTWLP